MFIDQSDANRHVRVHTRTINDSAKLRDPQHLGSLTSVPAIRLRTSQCAMDHNPVHGMANDPAPRMPRQSDQRTFGHDAEARDPATTLQLGQLTTGGRRGESISPSDRLNLVSGSLDMPKRPTPVVSETRRHPNDGRCCVLIAATSSQISCS